MAVCRLGGLRRVHLHPLFAQWDVLIPETQPFTFKNLTQTCSNVISLTHQYLLSLTCYLEFYL